MNFLFAKRDNVFTRKLPMQSVKTEVYLMKLFTNTYSFICPFCFERISLYDVKFRCANAPTHCPPEVDDVYSRFHGVSSKIMPRVIFPSAPKGYLGKAKTLRPSRKINCSNCGFPTTNRICPYCHNNLPYTIGGFKDLIFAIIGAKETGKSHYMSVLISEIENRVGTSFNCTLQAVDDQTMHRYRESFYNPVFRKHETIQPTRSARADFSVRTPLVYSMRFIKKGLFNSNKIKNVTTISFFDTAGEDLDSEDTMSTENRYIYNSSGIIILLDPLQLPVIREKLFKGTPLPQENTEIDDIITRTANLIRKAKELKPNDFIDIPIAVAFSKMDAVYTLIEPSSQVMQPNRHNGSFDVRDFEDINTEMEAHVHEWAGGHLIQQLKGNFKDYAFFGLTALGCNPHGTQKIPKLRPNRVEDPFLWLLTKHALY